MSEKLRKYKREIDVVVAMVSGDNSPIRRTFLRALQLDVDFQFHRQKIIAAFLFSFPNCRLSKVNIWIFTPSTQTKNT